MGKRKGFKKPSQRGSALITGRNQRWILIKGETMEEFTRTLDKKKIERLLDRESNLGRLFCDYLAPRIMCGEIFIAIRNNKIDFYVGGNRFLEYSGKGFKANPKIFNQSEQSKMICVENALPKNWEKSLDEYMQRCLNYTSSKSDQAERKIIQAYFPVYYKQNKVIVLDREVRINDGDGRKCDWLLYNKATGELKFVEVKISDHSSLRHNKDGKYEVMEQLNGYSCQYEKHEDRIVEQYKKYVDILNRLLGLSLSSPKKMLDTKAGLAIFMGKRGVEENLIDQIHPFIGSYLPAVQATTEEIWNHFETCQNL